MKKKNNSQMNDYFGSTHRLGRLSTLIAILGFVSVPTLYQLIWGVKVDFGATITGLVAVLSVFGIVSVVEWLSYPAVIGFGGSYISFITGNISNMKLPAALNGLKISEKKSGTKEGDIVATIATSVSSVVTTLILFLGIFILNLLLPILNSPVLKPGFDNLMPAILGALSIPMFKKNLKTASVPSIIAAILTLIVGYAMVSRYQPFLTILFLLITVGWSYILYSKNSKKDAKQTQEE